MIFLAVKQQSHCDFPRGFKVKSPGEKHGLLQATFSAIIKAGDVRNKAGSSGDDDAKESLYQWLFTTRNWNVPIPSLEPFSPQRRISLLFSWDKITLNPVEDGFNVLKIATALFTKTRSGWLPH